MTMMPQAAPRPLFPVAGRTLLFTVLLSGLAADLVWEIWARGITPLLVGGPLQPAALVQSVFGFRNWPLAEAIHAFVGVVCYPLGWLFIARPLQRALLPGLPLVLAGAGFGLGLWVFALYVMAHLLAGLPAFLGFGSLAWASLAGHLLFGITVALVSGWRERRAGGMR
ncbi:MAG: hypothetical protein KDK03_13080 [Rhodobacteraceae bacterium]|nr:hypothetical protein [Paracoccaceae bacterium]